MLGGLNKTEEKALREFKEILVKKFGENVRTIRLFGSKARGDSHPESDIDVLVLIKKSDFRVKDQIVDVAGEILMKYNIYISPRVITEDHFSYLKYLETSLVENIEKESILV